MKPRLPWAWRQELAALPETLEQLAALAEIRGEMGTAHALREGATRFTALGPAERLELGRALRWSRPTDTTPLPADAADAVRRVLNLGAPALLAAERRRLPLDLAGLLDVPGVQLADLLNLHRRFGIVSAGDLALLADAEATTDAGDALVSALAALPALRARRSRIPLGRAIGLAERVRAAVRAAGPGLPVPTAVGSVRRYAPTVGDLEFLVEAGQPTAALEALVGALAPSEVRHRGPLAVTLVVNDEQITIRAATPDAYPFALIALTGAPGHVRLLQERARARGWTFGAAGARLESRAAPLGCRDEAGVYAALDLPYIEPELRHGEDEIARAERGALPALVSRDDIRGDLHVHTLWSDGRDSVEDMVRAARLLGYEYVAITDHSQSAAASRVLTIERLERQVEEVARARTRVEGITVLHGAEVDILPDGSLDFPDAILDRLDIVLASLHDPAGQPPDVLLGRYLSAMRHPRVHVITHPANRLVGRDDQGYALDYDTLFAAAVDTGTVLEVDGGPAHLDLDGHLAGRAVQSGVTVSIDSDCHAAGRLGRQMQLGIGTARRGGVGAASVLNTRPVADVLAFFERKRGR